VRSDSHENGKHDQRKAGKGIDAKGTGSELKSLSRACGQTRGEGFFGIPVEEPKHEQTERQVKHEDAQPCVAKGAMMCEGGEVLEIGGKAADNHGRQDETGASKREGGCGMGQSKRHY